MKFYWVLLVCSLTWGTASAAQESDFISEKLFFEEALRQYNPDINLGSLKISPEFESENIKISNIKAKISTLLNSPHTDEQIYKVSFNYKTGHQVQCLGALLEIDHPIMDLAVAQDFAERSAEVIMTECSAKKGEQIENFAPNHQIKMVVAFPKPATLPIMNAPLVEAFRTYIRLKPEQKISQCVSKNINSHMLPRSAVSTYDLKDHYLVDVFQASSSLPDTDRDVAVRVDEIDLGSMGWLEDNINFFKNIGGDRSSFQILFKKSNCRQAGPNQNPTLMTCIANIAPEHRRNDISRVTYTFQSRMITEPYLGVSANAELEMHQYMEFKNEFEFVIDKPNKYLPYPTTRYRNKLSYTNQVDGAKECLFKQ